MSSALRACIASTAAAVALSVTVPRAQDVAKPAVELTQAQIEVKVKEDVARRLRLRAEDVRVVESASRTWPDRGLGCAARRGVFEPSDVPGFVVVAEAGTRRFTYHTDRYGRIVRCRTPSKPFDPIR
jgi:hypothetical protein